MMSIPVSPILPRKTFDGSSTTTFGDNGTTISTSTAVYANAKATVDVPPRFPSLSEHHQQQEQHYSPGDFRMSRTCLASGCLFPNVDQVHKPLIDGPSPNNEHRQLRVPKNDDSSASAAALPYNNNISSNDDIGGISSNVFIPSGVSRPSNNNSITITSQQLRGNGSNNSTEVVRDYLVENDSNNNKNHYRASTIAETPPHRDRTGSYLNGFIPPIPPKRMLSSFLQQKQIPDSCHSNIDRSNFACSRREIMFDPGNNNSSSSFDLPSSFDPTMLQTMTMHDGKTFERSSSSIHSNVQQHYAGSR